MLVGYCKDSVWRGERGAYQLHCLQFAVCRIFLLFDGTFILLDSTVLYCTVLYCTVLYCTVLYCTVLYCTALHCTAINWVELKWVECSEMKTHSRTLFVLVNHAMFFAVTFHKHLHRRCWHTHEASFFLLYNFFLLFCSVFMKIQDAFQDSLLNCIWCLDCLFDSF